MCDSGGGDEKWKRKRCKVRDGMMEYGMYEVGVGACACESM